MCYGIEQEGSLQCKKKIDNLMDVLSKINSESHTNIFFYTLSAVHIFSSIFRPIPLAISLVPCGGIC